MQTSTYDEREFGLEQQQERLSQQTLQEESHDGMAKALGWFSLGLGLAEVAAPRQVARFIGVQDRPNLLRVLGIREITSGLGILMQGNRPAPWLWSRVAGDALDLALLGVALGSEDSDRTRLGVATAAVVGVTALDVFSSTRQIRSEPIHVRKAITIDRPAEELYRFWRNFQNLPRFMKNLKSVQTLGADRSHWTALGPGGTNIEWDAEMTEDRPNQMIAWRSLEGADVDNWGSVRFRRAPRGTEVHVNVSYSPPGGRLGSIAAWFTGKEPGQQVQEDLRRLKQILEAGEIPTTEGQPSGESKTGILSSLFRTAERQRR